MGILFFNWYGYQLLSSYLESRANKQLVARLDQNNYDESQLLSIKVPAAHLSYYNSSTQFERVDGRVEVGGIEYNYVKRRLFNDSLELLCIPNTTATNLQKAKNDFFRQVNDLQQQNQGKKNNSAPTKDFSKDYTPSAMDIILPAVLTNLSSAKGTLAASQLPTRYTPTAERPPDQTSVLS